MDSFQQFDLKRKLLTRLNEIGWSKPSPIQQESLPHILSGRDLIAQGKTGSGMTGAFAIGILQKIDTEWPGTQALVLSPTHESARLAEITIGRLGRFLEVTCCSSIGGTDVDGNIEALDAGVQVAVGTLGRMTHMMQTRHLTPTDVQLLVVDEADLMLSPKFRSEFHFFWKMLMRYLKSKKRTHVQTLMFSSTIPKKLPQWAAKYVRDPAVILLPKKERVPQNIAQYYVVLESEESRLDAFCALFPKITASQLIVFCVDFEEMTKIQTALEAAELDSLYLDPKMDEEDRSETMRQFLYGMKGKIVSTGSLSRGLDLERVKVVVNYNLPRAAEYLHCIGRCGRNGRKGLAITLVLPLGEEFLLKYAKKYGVNIEKLPTDLTSVLSQL